MQRMRTAAGVLAEIKEQDPKTEVTLHYIRFLINTNAVKVIPVGRKKLVDVDAVLTLLSVGVSTDESKFGQIRQVKV